MSARIPDKYWIEEHEWGAGPVLAVRTASIISRTSEGFGGYPEATVPRGVKLQVSSLLNELVTVCTEGGQVHYFPAAYLRHPWFWRIS